MRPLAITPATLLLAGCLHRAPEPPAPPPRGPARDSLLLLDLTRGDTLAARGPVDGMVALFRPDVVLLRAGVPAVYGREAARRVLTVAAGAGANGNGGGANALVLWQPLGGGLSRDGGSGYTYGVTTRGPITRTGARIERYLAFWQRDVGSGSAAAWRIAAYAEVGGPGAEGPVREELTVPPAPRAPSRRAADVAAILRGTDSLFSDHADRLGVADAFSTYVADDGAVFAGSELVVGQKAVGDLFGERAGTSLSWKPVYAAAAASGDLGFTVGTSVRTARGPSGAAVQTFGKYLTVWKRQPDGSWRFVIDGGSITR